MKSRVTSNSLRHAYQIVLNKESPRFTAPEHERLETYALRAVARKALKDALAANIKTAKMKRFFSHQHNFPSLIVAKPETSGHKSTV